MGRRPLAVITPAVEHDIALAVALDRDARRHEADAIRARAERRRVWLRLFETHGLTYDQLTRTVGASPSTLFKEVSRARNERGGGG